MFILDLIIIGFILLMTFIGYKKGLINMAFSIVSFFIAILISLLLYKPISNIIITKTTIDETIQNTIYEKLSSKSDTELEESFGSFIENAKKEATNNVANQISQKVSTLIVNLGTWLILLIITKLILMLFKTILNAIANLPFLKQINKTGGFIFGFLKGLLITYVVLAVLFLTSNIFVIEGFNNLLNQSILTKLLYNNNLIILFFY